jgi:hypothetical protein
MTESGEVVYDNLSPELIARIDILLVFEEMSREFQSTQKHK